MDRRALRPKQRKHPCQRGRWFWRRQTWDTAIVEEEAASAGSRNWRILPMPRPYVEVRGQLTSPIRVSSRVVRREGAPSSAPEQEPEGSASAAAAAEQIPRHY